VVVDKLNSGEVTPLDLLDILEQRIAEIDDKVNALPTLCFDRARTHAKALMKKPSGGRGLLAGMPVPIKDLTDVEGVLTTQGSPIYRNNIPARSDLLVRHLETNGAVIYASPLLARRAGRPSRSQPEWRGSRMALTWAARFAALRASAELSACDRVSGALRIPPSPRSIVTSAYKGRWRAMWRTSPCCLMP
jgi:hypothetical protein